MSVSVSRRISIRGLASALGLSASLLIPFGSYAQQRIAPQWLNDGWRSANYPQSVWFTGFAQDGLKAGENEAAATRRVEQDARNKLSENISSRLTSASRNETSSNRVSSGTQSKEVVERSYGQIIQTSTSAEVVKTELYPYHDVANKRVYAFAAVKKSSLAAYYASMIESGLTEAERGLELAKQSMELGKKDAGEKLSAGKAKIASLGYYRDLLIAVDGQKGLEQAQNDRVTALLKEIEALSVDVEDAARVYVTGTETILGESASIIIPALKGILNDNGCRIVESEGEAGYVLKIEAKACQVDPPKTSKFYFCTPCVDVTLTSVNVKTGKGKIEVTANLTGKNGLQKKQGNTASEAGEAAFKVAAPEVWKKVSGTLAANR